jgi:hypothetical protein
MTLKNLLKGKTDQAQHALDEFFSGIDEEKILWYPSAGRDYRDLIETTPERLALHGISEQPNIICHTDCNPSWTGLDQDRLLPMIMHQDMHTTVTLMEKFSLTFAPDINIHYHVRDSHVSAYDPHQPGKAAIYFLTLKIMSDTQGEFTVQMFYFMFENYNFLEELILKNKLAITHFVKVRQGCGMGGCGKCISVFYSLLENIGVKYLLVDGEVHYCHETHARLASQFHIKHKNYKLISIGIPLKWSDYDVRAFRVESLPGYLENSAFNLNLASISLGWSSDPWEPQQFFPIQNHSLINK